MSIYKDSQDDSGLHDDSAGENTMAVLSTLGGGEDPLAEGEPLGLDPDADKGKISGSSLAVGVVVVLAAVALLGMRMTLGAIAGGNSPAEDIAQIETFLTKHSAAVQTGNQGPISAPDDESKRVLDDLKKNPTDHQVPPEEVETNPFDITNVVTHTVTATSDTPGSSADPRAIAQDKARKAAKSLKIDSISGKMAFINGELYRVGDKIGSTGFMLESIEGLKCKIRTTDQYGFTMVLEYR